MPSFLTDVLEQLGWSDGTFLPVANEENKSLELLLEQRNKELIQLKSETDAQTTKQNELALHRKNLLSEHQANMHLLVVHKEQMENEDHLSRIAANEAGKIKKDADDMDKQCQDMERKAEGLRVDIARVLRKVESRRMGIGEDRNSLEEWKSALKRGEADIQAIEAFSKEDKHKVEVLDGKRQRLKMDYDKKQEALFKFCCNLQSEERTAERVSHQVEEALAQRRETLATWAGAVECLRQRDKDITQMKQELEMLRDYAKERGDQLMEKQDFLNAQLNNNKEAEKELAEAKDVLAHERMRLSKLQTSIKTMDNQYICMKRELAATATQLSNCRLDNKRMYKEKEDKEEAINKLNEMIQNYKDKLAEVIDGTKTAEQRTRQLEDMLSNEEKYMRQLMSENDRLQHCIFRSQQLMESLKEEGNALKIEARGYRVAITQLGIKQTKLEKDLIGQKEVLYKVSYILEKMLLRLGRLEGTSVDYDEEERLEKRAGQLVLVAAERTNALHLLAAQYSRLVGEERTLARQLINNQGQHDIMKETMQKLTASGEGAYRCLLQVRRSGRARRAEEGALRLRAGHAERALQRLGDQGLCLEKAGLGLRAAVCERAAEAKERLAVLQAQRRVLLDEKGNLNADLRAEQLQVEQLRKKYDICISTMGKDEDGQALSVTYFMVKNAQEKAELQQEGDALDVQIRKSEKEIAALEATLQVVDTANRNFIRNLAPPQDDDAEVMELAALTQEFHRAREQKSQLNLQCSRQSDLVDELRKDIASLAPQIEELENDKDSLLDEMSNLQKELFDQQDKLSRARAQCKRARIAAKKKIRDPQLWSMYETDIEWRGLAEANKSAASQLLALQMPELEERARQQGLNLSAIHSGPLTGIKLGSQSGRSSLLSETGSMAVRSVCDCTITSPFPSVGVPSTSSSGIRDKLEASRTVRSPLSDSQVVISAAKKPSSMSQSKHGKQGGTHLSSASMPLSVVMLGLDTEPVKESTSSSQRSLVVRGSSSQRSISSEQSTGKGDTRKTLHKKGTSGK